MDSYSAEIELLDKEHELMKLLLETQISLEKTENKNLQESLCWSYSLANKFEDKKWMYSDAEDLLRNFVKSEQKNKDTQKFVKNQLKIKQK